MSFRQPGQLRPRRRQPAVPPGWTAYRRKEGGPSEQHNNCVLALLPDECDRSGTLLCVFRRSEHFLGKLRVTPAAACHSCYIEQTASPHGSLGQQTYAVMAPFSWLISDINYICRTWFLQEETASFLPITPHCAMPLKFIRAHTNSGNLFTLFPI